LTGKPAGSTASLINPTSARPTFTPDVAGVYTATLVVHANGVASPPKTVTITCVTGNVAPRADAGPDRSAIPGRAITLDGTASRDPNKTPLTYSWRIVKQPAGSNPILANPTTAKPTFTADVVGQYIVALTVSDGSLTSPADQVQITVATGNQPPMANAGPDQTVTAGQVVTLDGRGSTDPNGDPLTYSWCLRGRPQGSTATLNGANTAQPTFTPDVAGSYVLCLTVNDGKAGSASDSVVVEARLSLPTTRQGPMLQGGDAQTATGGGAVAVSADGNTIIFGAPAEGLFGAAWVFTRTNDVWTQQGPKLVGAGAVLDTTSRFPVQVSQGSAVALSADGNTALVGGPGDNIAVGATWVFTRTNGVWTQQGPKLLGANTTGRIGQGTSVALTADGNTAAIGAPGDNGSVGAIFIFMRNAGVWTQQAKILGTDSIGAANLGSSVALSNDGTTLVAGGPRDDENPATGRSFGAVWVFTRSGATWTQQGPKLVGTGATEDGARQGHSIALSADGNTVLTGAPGTDGARGAAWVFTRTNDVWTQQGPKLESNDEGGTSISPPLLGSSVALSDDGNIALIGGPGDTQPNRIAYGAAWFFSRSGGVWTQQGPKIVDPDLHPGPPMLGNAVALSADATTAAIGTAAIGNPGGVWVYVP
jgi:hypothetical protein